MVTFKERCNVPGRDPSLLHELAQRDLQEEDRDASDEHDQQVRDQEYPYNIQNHIRYLTSQHVWLIKSMNQKRGRLR